MGDFSLDGFDLGAVLGIRSGLEPQEQTGGCYRVEVIAQLSGASRSCPRKGSCPPSRPQKAGAMI